MTSNYYYGIRRFPRAPITYLGANGKPYNPFTFKYVNADCDTNIGTTATGPNSAFPRNPVVSTSSGSQACDQVHNLGEVWSSALWEVRNRMVTRLGFSAGTNRVLQAVTDGMKLAPLGPTFLQERDAIIAAASALPLQPEASADVLDVREGFRVRGMGFSAAVTNAGTGSNNTVVVEGFDVPNVVFTTPITVSDSVGDNDGFPEPGENVLVSVPILNNTGASVASVSATVTGGATASYGTIADGTTVTRTMAYTIPAGAACGSLVTINITGTSALGALNPTSYTFRVGVPVGGAPTTFTSAVPVRIPGGTATVGTADVYPTTLNVSGVTGNKTITLEFTNLNTTYPGDMDWLLVGPGGQKFIVMSDVISAFTTQTNAVVKLKDSATDNLPAAGAVNMTGDWKPTDITSGDVFAGPAPAGPYMSPAPVGGETFATVFGSNGANMNGTWNLYGVDDVSGDFATIGGWKLTFEANDYACAVQVTNKKRADFDGDGKSDLSVFRGSDTNWYIQKSSGGISVTAWGAAGDIPTPGDFDGDGKTDLAVFRPSAGSPNNFVLNSNGNVITTFAWGQSGDVPVTADYDGDGKADAAVFRASDSNWYIRKSTGGLQVSAWGVAGDIATPGDYNGDGKSDYAIYRPSNNNWYILNSAGGISQVAWGAAGDKTVAADYDGDGKDDIAVFRASAGLWYIVKSSGGIQTISWGQSGDVAVPGDYDGDGKYDAAIFRSGTWWISKSGGGITSTAWGTGSDIAIPSRYVP